MRVISKQHRACTRTTSKSVYSFLSTKLAGSFFLPFTFVFAPPLPLFHYTTRRPTSAFIRTPALRITKGPLVTEVDVVMSNVRHTVRLFGSKNGLLKHAISIQNVVNVQTMDNKELVMRIKTDVKNQKVFFTDLNGFSMRKRTTLAKLPMQANFFPLPGQAFWEDATKRVSLHSRSSLGCASLEGVGLKLCLTVSIRVGLRAFVFYLLLAVAAAAVDGAAGGLICCAPHASSRLPCYLFLLPPC